jgi:hypothetical protein
MIATAIGMRIRSAVRPVLMRRLRGVAVRHGLQCIPGHILERMWDTGVFAATHGRSQGPLKLWKVAIPQSVSAQMPQRLRRAERTQPDAI